MDNTPAGPASGYDLRLRGSDAQTARSSTPPRHLRKSLNNAALLLAPGILGGLLVSIVYPPLDEGPLVAFGLCVLAIPVILQIRSNLRKRLRDDFRILRASYVCSSIVLAMLSGLLLLNGWLDKFPPSLVTTTLLEKKVSHGRSGATYSVRVSSWRPGRNSEDFRVDLNTYRRAIIGRDVVVEIHRGFFGVPWSGRISPQ